MLSYSMLSNTGNREKNEDFVRYVQKDGYFVFMVADGLGGHGKGELASRLVIKTIERCIAEQEEVHEMGQYIEEAQHMLRKEQKRREMEGEMLSTLVCLEIEEKQAVFVHIGDSRGYYFQNGVYRMRTMDHSVSQMLVNCGLLQEKEIRYHEDRNRLVHAMGVPWDEPQYEISKAVHYKKGDAFLLCSDGFWELIEERAMEEALQKSESAEEWLERMQQLVEMHGEKVSMDNYSAIAVMIL